MRAPYPHRPESAVEVFADVKQFALQESMRLRSSKNEVPAFLDQQRFLATDQVQRRKTALEVSRQLLNAN